MHVQTINSLCVTSVYSAHTPSFAAFPRPPLLPGTVQLLDVDFTKRRHPRLAWLACLSLSLLGPVRFPSSCPHDHEHDGLCKYRTSRRCPDASFGSPTAPHHFHRHRFVSMQVPRMLLPTSGMCLGSWDARSPRRNHRGAGVTVSFAARAGAVPRFLSPPAPQKRRKDISATPPTSCYFPHATRMNFDCRTDAFSTL